METMIFFAQTCLVAYLAAWMTTGVRDNLLYPTTNSAATDAVLRLERMAEQYPEDFALIAHRRVTEPRHRRAIFWLIVTCEAAACLALWIATLLMAAGLLGLLDPVPAKTVGLGATLAFTSIWAGFLIAGNHFGYWLCHEWAQATHYNMLLWGIGTMVFLVLG